MVYLVNDFTHLDDVYVRRRSTRKSEKKLSNHNAALLVTARSCRRSQRMTFKGADGWDVDGFFVKPVGWQAGQEVSDGAEHPRRAGRTVRRRLVSRVPGVRRARLGGVLHQPARFDGLRRASSSAASS